MGDVSGISAEERDLGVESLMTLFEPMGLGYHAANDYNILQLIFYLFLKL